MKTFFNSSAPKNSFFKKEQERIESLIKESLLELVLQYLPHLQSTIEQQNDVWEIIAMKLNGRQFTSALSASGSATNEVEEIATLNGPYIREVYSKLMEDFLLRVYSINRNGHVYKSEYARPPDGGPAPVGYAAFSLPVKEVLTERTDRILCELFYLKGYDIEVMSKLSKERFEMQQRAEFKKQLSDYRGVEKDTTNIPNSEAKAEEENENTNDVLEKVKESLGREKLDMYEKEFNKKTKKVDQLSIENKRLLELNHELVLELKQLRDKS